MTDPLSAVRRSRLMAKIRGRDTIIEKSVRSCLHLKGFRFRKNVRGLAGTPDIVLPKYNLIVFIHGCFWHGHPGCRKSRLPTTRRDFWEEKRRANLKRDAQNQNELLDSGWRVAVMWQCGLEKPFQLNQSLEALEKFAVSKSRFFEAPIILGPSIVKPKTLSVGE